MPDEFEKEQIMPDELDDIPVHSWHNKPVVTFESFIGTFKECPRDVLDELQKRWNLGYYEEMLQSSCHKIDGADYYDINVLWRILHNRICSREGSTIGIKNGGIKLVEEMFVL